MCLGIELGITQPLEGLQNYQATYNPYIVENPKESIFFKPLLNKPQQYNEKDWLEAKELVQESIIKNVVPSYQRVKDFFENEYFPNTRKGLGASTIPKGKSYYEHKTRFYTTQNITPQEVHEIGLKEVERIKAQMYSTIEQLEFEGEFSQFVEFLRTDQQFYPKTRLNF